MTKLRLQLVLFCLTLRWLCFARPVMLSRGPSVKPSLEHTRELSPTFESEQFNSTLLTTKLRNFLEHTEGLPITFPVVSLEKTTSGRSYSATRSKDKRGAKYRHRSGFPENFRGLLITLAIVEGVTGILKSKFGFALYCILLTVEILCAAGSSAALLVPVIRGTYSNVEVGAAYLTVCVDAGLLLWEAYIVLVPVYKGNVGNSFQSFLLSALVSVVLVLFTSPILMAVVRGRTLQPFKTLKPGIYLLALVICVGLVGILWVILAIAEELENETTMFVVSILSVGLICGAALGVGIVILNRGENLSLSFIIISNLYPAIITFLGAYPLLVHFRK